MIIICPKCNLNYQIKGDLISENGRKVKCFSCESFWIQYPNGKIKELKIEKDFSIELQKRQNFIRNSLNNNQNNDKSTKPTLLSKDIEKEFLSSLALSEIEQNKFQEYKYQNVSDSMNRVGKIRDKLSSNEKKGIKNTKTGINETYFGFFFVGFLVLGLVVIYKNQDFIKAINPKFFKQISILVDYTDNLIINLTLLIKKLINFIKLS